jgi:glyoxylase-like metal-dependent hydrolase (beta-lactamase superfamily II)
LSRSKQDIELPSGIYQLKLAFPKNPLGAGSALGYVLAYLVEIEGGFVLIDTGWNDEGTLNSLTEQLRTIGVGFDDIRYVLVTHHHLDHMGLAAEVRERSGGRLAMHSLEMPGTIKDYYMSLSSTPSDWFRDWLRSHGMPQADLDALPPAQSGIDRFLPPTSVDIVINGGESRHDGLVDLEVVWTPGHSPGHICVYDRRRKVLFAGDHLLPRITPHISLQPHVQGNPLGDYLNSLRALQKLEVSLVLPAHEHAFTNLDERISELLEHHHGRLNEILGSLGGGPKVAYEVSADVTWDVGSWSEMSPWLKQMSLFETLAHLEHLQVEGKVQVLERQGRTYYQLR